MSLSGLATVTQSSADQDETSDSHQQHYEPWSAAEASEAEVNYLRQRAQELSQAWNAFKEKLPADAQARFDGQTSTVEDVRDVMVEVEQEWDQKRKKGFIGKAGIFYRRACIGIKDHQTLLSMIPEGSEYVSLFSGSLKSIVFATARHEQIASDLSGFVSDITTEVAFCNEIKDLYKTKGIGLAVMTLYGLIFKFFADVIQWYNEKAYKKILKSFNESLQKDFARQVEDILKCARAIKERASILGQGAEIRSTRLFAEALLKQFSEVQGVSKDWNAFRVEQQRLIDQQEQRLLASHDYQQELQQALLAHAFKGGPVRRRTHSIDAVEGGKIALQTQVRDKLLAQTAALEDLFERSQVRLPASEENVRLPEDAIDPWRDWLQSESSTLLVLSGEEAESTKQPSLTSFATHLIQGLAEQGVPVVSYFCASGRVAPDRSLLSLLGALVRQLVELSSADGLDTQTEGTDNNSLLMLIDKLLSVAPPMLYIVIDGIERTDTQSTQEQLSSLLSSIRQSMHSRTMKVLFTTSRPSRFLLKATSRKEYRQLEGKGQLVELFL